MCERGLSAQRPRRFVPRTTDSSHDQPIAPNRLATRPAPTGRDQVWVSDLTYVPTAEGWRYAAVILERWSRRIIGWACADNLGAQDTALAALRMALRHRRPPRGLLHHSDRRGGGGEKGGWRAGEPASNTPAPNTAPCSPPPASNRA